MTGIVAETPAANTPNITGPRRTNYAADVAQIGNKVFVVGRFDSVRNPGSSNDISRFNVFAYNATTGVVDTAFAPQVNGLIDAVVPHPDGQSVFIVGNFSQVNGQPSFGLARLNVNTGQRVAGFNTTTEGRVRDAVVRGNTLFLAGDFWRVGGANRSNLAAINVNSGAVLALDVPVTDPRQGGSTWVATMDVSADGGTISIAGNFRTVGGLPRVQLAAIDTAGSGSVIDWRARDYEDPCNTNAFWTYMRDVEFSPEGEYLVVATTGGPYTGQICDTAARLETEDRGDVTPSWVNWSGGDTLTALAVTDGVVYVGGHQRWMNNHLGRDNVRMGAVDRPGIAALDPINGVPLRWNPTRDRGATVFGLYVAPGGNRLIMAHDTDIVNNLNRWKLAAWDIAPITLPKPTPVGLPVALLQSQINGSLTTAAYDGDEVSSRTEVEDTGVDWSLTRGTTFEAGWVFYADSTGNLYRRSYDGVEFGAEEDLTTGVYASTSSFNIPRLTSNAAMTWDAGRVYFNRTNSSLLRYQYLSLESGILGSQTFTVSTPGLSWLTTTAMEIIDDHLYRVRSDGLGHLYRLDMVDGVPTGPEVAVSGPTIDGRDWSGRDFFATAIFPPPTVELVAPVQGANLSGEVTLEASASAGVEAVEFFVGEISAGVDSDGTDGWSLLWNSAAVGNGEYEITASASQQGQSAVSDPVTVTITNAESSEVLLVVGNGSSPDPDDEAILSRLQSNGYTVTVIDDNAAILADTANKAFVLVASSTNAFTVGTTLNASTTPILVAKAYSFGRMGLTGQQAEVDYGSSVNSTMTIVDSGHPLAAGQTGAVALRSGNTRFSWGIPVAGATVVAEVVGNPTIFTIPAGTTLSNGDSAAGCRMTFPLYTNQARWYSETGWSMFDVAASWASGRCTGLGNPPPPNEPPSVTITAPADGATVSDDVTVSADAVDDHGVGSVEFLVDGGSIGVDSDGSDGWSVVWDSTTVADGQVEVGAVATDTNDQTGSDSVSVTVDNEPAGDDPEVLLVVGNADSPTPDDTAIVERLEGTGHEVVTVGQSSTSAADAAGKAFVLITNSTTWVLGNRFNDVNVPVWNTKPALFGVMGLTGTEENVDFGSVVVDGVSIVDTSHALAAGLSGTVSLRPPPGRYSWGIPAASAEIVANAGDNPTIFSYPAGATLANGSAAPACRMTFPLFANSVRWYNSSGWQMFDAAAEWAGNGCE
jgi:hypothetical protein